MAIRQLQEIDRATHPAQRSKDRRPTNPASQDAADVFAALDAEDDEDPEAASWRIHTIKWAAVIQAAKATTQALLLAAVCLPAFANIPRSSLVAEKPHQGVESFALASRQGLANANVLIAPGIAGCLCDEDRRSRSTGKERDAETGLDYFGARYMSAAQGRFTGKGTSA
ncbi:hypothetical protein [Bryobacter aggregatus]|uniref:hypothetical protein n=1 Tax=Bryobacter aggregatus TaxID=360054 RepID=UPI0004E1FD17|nr:hypothetical protein [Bryobacter aggregatus]